MHTTSFRIRHTDLRKPFNLCFLLGNTLGAPLISYVHVPVGTSYIIFQVRELKGAKASKDEVTAAVKVLLDLKAKYKVRKKMFKKLTAYPLLYMKINTI